MGEDLTPAERFIQDLNTLTSAIGDLGLYWRGDLAQFTVTDGGLVHVCGTAIGVNHGDRLDIIARMATTHLLSCASRCGHAPRQDTPLP